VTFAGVWIAPADDLEDAIILRFADLSESTSREGRVRQYAGGRRRLVSTPQRNRRLKVATPPMPRVVVAELEDRTGTLQLLRDSKGRVVLGTWWDLEVSEVIGTNRVELSLMFEATTDTVAV